MPNMMRKRFLIPAVLLFLADGSWAQTNFSDKLVLCLTGGLSVIGINESSSYRDEWKLELLSRITEQNQITAKSKNALFVGVSLSYFIRPNFGLEAGLGFFQAEIPNSTAFQAEYAWSSGATFTRNAEWAGTGDIRVIPISLNISGRSQKKKIEVFGSAGLTLFWNAIRSTAAGGFCISEVAYIQTYAPPNWEKTVIQSVDALPVTLEIEKSSWVSPGLNVGGGIDFRLSAKTGLIAGFRYYLCPKKDFEWKWKPGLYDGIDGNITDWEFTRDNAKYAASRTTPAFKVNPTFLQVGLGIKLFL